MKSNGVFYRFSDRRNSRQGWGNDVRGPLVNNQNFLAFILHRNESSMCWSFTRICMQQVYRFIMLRSSRKLCRYRMNRSTNRRNVPCTPLPWSELCVMTVSTGSSSLLSDRTGGRGFSREQWYHSLYFATVSTQPYETQIEIYSWAFVSSSTYLRDASLMKILPYIYEKWNGTCITLL